ncbi:zinc ribbon domain-containing protein [Oceanobacillus sp. Castelsardo]|uniref:TcaA 3rd/4th domain-containing protein n=1 Tax=Oceanobacillus sp. Castelsardo TaxID=1851204 RepID=UPI000838D8EC|nr:zinc ribbon domain-containing protein [Oceanobacillus sp. Castelsardo]
MKYCKNCGHPLKDGVSFCAECGSNINEKTVSRNEGNEPISKPTDEKPVSRETRPKKPLFKSKKSKVTAIIAIIIGIILFASYYTINKVMMSPEAVSNNFIKALTEKDVNTVRKYINEGQLEMDATKEDTEAFLAFLEERPKMITAISKQLKKDAHMYKSNGNHLPAFSDEESDTLASLTKDGKKWLLFDRYVVQLLPNYLEVESTEEKTKIFVGKNEVGTIGSEKPKTFGPFLPGIYEVKAVVDGAYGKVENVQEIDFSQLDETEASASFNFSDHYLDIYTDNEDAALFVNGKDTKKHIGDLNQFGPVPLDGSVEVFAQKDFSSGLKKSKKVKITEDIYDLNLYLDYDDDDEEYELAQKEAEAMAKMEEEEAEVAETVYNHYSRISNDDFQNAYNLFSSNMKKKFGVDGWAKGLEANIRDYVSTVQVQSVNENNAKAYLEMTSYDDQEDGSILVQEWEGYWNLIKENGQWRLDKAELEKVDSWKE